MLIHLCPSLPSSLSVYPAVFTRLRAEILERVGCERRPTYDDIREMKYLRAVINGAAHPSRYIAQLIDN
jgi:hypothetical protein